MGSGYYYCLISFFSSKRYKSLIGFFGSRQISSRSVIAFLTKRNFLSCFSADEGNYLLIFTPCGDYYKSTANPARSELRIRLACVSLESVPSDFTADICSSVTFIRGLTLKSPGTLAHLLFPKSYSVYGGIRYGSFSTSYPV